MKRLFFVFFVLTPMVCLAQQRVDTLLVNNTTFIAITKTVKCEYSKTALDTVLYLYRLENNHNTYLLKHDMYRYSGDCNNEYTDVGTYRIKGDSLIFFTRYYQKGSDPIPMASEQIYVVNNLGKLILKANREKDMNGKWHIVTQ